jgi:hypothetical protein
MRAALNPIAKSKLVMTKPRPVKGNSGRNISTTRMPLATKMAWTAGGVNGTSVHGRKQTPRTAR